MFQFSKNIESQDYIKSFKALSSSEFNDVKQRKKQLRYNKRETICKQGNFAPNIMYLEEGLAKLYFQGKNKKNLIIKIVTPYDFIGLSSLFGKNYCYYSVVALTDATVNMIAKDDFKNNIISNSKFASKIIELYCNNNALFFSRLNDVATKHVHARLADAILYLTETKYCGKNLLSLITRKELAEITNVSVEGAIRLLSEFKKEGIIDINGKNIEIINHEKLKRISDVG